MYVRSYYTHFFNFWIFNRFKERLHPQFIHLAGFIIAFIIAYMYYDKLAPKLTLWVPYPDFRADSALSLLMDNVNLEDAYYRAIAFVVIFFV